MWNCCAMACGKERCVIQYSMTQLLSSISCCSRAILASSCAVASSHQKNLSQVNDDLHGDLLSSQLQVPNSSKLPPWHGTLKFRPNLITYTWVSFIGLCSCVARHLAGHLGLALLHILCKSPKTDAEPQELPKLQRSYVLRWLHNDVVHFSIQDSLESWDHASGWVSSPREA